MLLGFGCPCRFQIRKDNKETIEPKSVILHNDLGFVFKDMMNLITEFEGKDTCIALASGAGTAFDSLELPPLLPGALRLVFR